MQNSANNDPNNNAFLWGPILAIALLTFAWYFLHRQISAFIMHWHVFELSMLLKLYTPFVDLLHMLRLPSPDLSSMRHVLQKMSHLNYQNESYQQLFLCLEYISHKTRYLFSSLIGMLGIYAFFFMGGQRFRTIYSMSSISKCEVKNWPQITPVLSQDLLKKDLDEGPWAMAMQPLAFCHKHGIVDQESAKRTGKIVFLEKKASKVFAMQLGAPWRGVRNLPMYAKALFVIFAASASYDRKLSEKLLDQLSASSASGQLNFTGIDALVSRFENEDYVKWLDKTHAYVGTWMASLLAISRNSGVLASSTFLWLKPIDRRLWYILNTMGRKTAVPEVAGLYAHWLAECKLQRSLKTPMVKQAVSSLEEYLSGLLVEKEGAAWLNSVA